ncbi:SID1 transmembrane family member 1-like isoform X2 [Rhopilema esculentum]|uniref:SID1 transmembrane family member 1-like isoform X2 n=1 Tax=Rhopilema esculentum TaxID=499914 RepID=UPI0031D0D7F0
MLIRHFLELLALSALYTYNEARVFTKMINASLGTTYGGEVSRFMEDMYHVNSTIATHGEQSAIRLSVKSTSANADFPVLFVVRMVKGVRSWTVPFALSDGTIFHYVSRSLCPSLNLNKNRTAMPYFYVDVSTESFIPIQYSLTANIVEHFTLRVNEREGTMVQVDPAEPVYFRYKFEANVDRVLVKVTSGSTNCGMILVQNSKCPIFEEGTNDFNGLYATITTKAAISVSKKMIRTESFYVVLLVKDKDTDCLVHKGDINPFKRDDTLETPGNSMYPFKAAKLASLTRFKNFTIRLEKLPSDDDYIPAIIAPVLIYGSFYMITLIVIIISWCRADDGGRSFFAYLLPSKVKVKNEKMEEDGEGRRLCSPTADMQTYGLVDNGLSRESRSEELQNVSQIDPGATPKPTRGVSELDGDYDLLDDIDKHKDIYRLKRTLYLTDITKKTYKKLRKRFNVYYWNIITIAIFYALPVIQLVITYQRVVNTSGDQDICYYNFLCARQLGVLSAFNNVYSNIGYIMLGILFLLIVLRRDRLAKQKYVKDPEREKMHGIPGHFGILYAMGFALIMEGVLSACYHVCPNYSNFQFDTAFMYIIGLLGGLRLYQIRHQDIVINGHLAYTSFAIVIFTSVIGVVFRSKVFWGIFMVLHLLTCLYLSLQIYYMGRVKAAFKDMYILTKKDFGRGPVFKDRFALLFIFMVVNCGLSINGLVNMPADFATYLLGIIILNGMLYVLFYVFMKIRYKEKLRPLPLVCTLLSVSMWGCALVFFFKGLTNWQYSPAKSREGNRECRVMDFYDDHDIWHFLSSMAMFFTFTSLMTLDDDLDEKERNKINVF